MFAKIKALFSFPCAARLAAAAEDNRAAHERLRKAVTNMNAPFVRRAGENDFSHVADLRHIRNPS